MLSNAFAAVAWAFTAAGAVADVARMSAVPVEVRVSAAPGQTLPSRVRIGANWIAAADPTVHLARAVFVADVAEGKGVLELVPGTWEVFVEGDRVWSPRRQINVPKETALTLDVWPSAALTGLVGVPAGQSVPANVSVRVDLGIGVPRAGFKATTATCPVQEGRFRCTIPATRVDLVARVASCVSHYFWDVTLAPGQTKDLGTLQFERGASLVGFVRLADRGAPCHRCSVKLAAPSGEEIRGGKALATTTNARGFYQIKHVPATQYAVVATAPGYATSSESVRVIADAEANLVTMELERPAEMIVTVDPPRPFDSDQWFLQIVEFEDGRSKETVVPALPIPQVGTVTVPGLAPGTFRVTLAKSNLERWLHQEVTVVAPRTHVDLRIPSIAIAGRVTLGKRPLANARVVFGGARGAVSIPFDADDAGIFRGRIPLAPERAAQLDGEVARLSSGRVSQDGKTDEWRVSVSADNPKVNRVLSRVRVTPSDSSEVPVTLALDDTVVRGRLVMSDGSPATGRHLINIQSLAAAERTVQISTTDQSFTVHGLPVGDAAIVAEGRQEMSDELRIKVRADGLTEVTIALRGTRTVSGVVRSASGGPVPGAVLRVSPSQRSFFWPIVPTRANVRGEFSFAVPHETTDVNIVVGAVGQPLTIARAKLNGEPLHLSLAPTGGTLSIPSTVEMTTTRYYEDAVVMIFSGRGYIPIWDLADWARAQKVLAERDPDGLTGPLVVRNVRPGLYAACRVDYRTTPLADSVPLSACERPVQVSAGGVHELSVPARPKSAQLLP